MLLFPTAALAGFGIEPGKVYIDNLFPGAKAEFEITVFNQGAESASYVIKPRLPDYTDKDKGYEPLPYQQWLTATPDQLTISAGNNAKTLITVAMPNDSTYLGKKGEIWVSVMEKDNPAMVRIEVASRIFIATRAEGSGNPTATAGGSVGITAEPGSNSASYGRGIPMAAIIGAALAVIVIGVIAALLLSKRKTVIN